MPDAMKITDKAVDSDRKAKRMNRLRSLAGKRPGGAEAPAEGDAAALAARRKAIARIYRVLSETSPDDTGMVEGTPFSQAGVLRLMETLKSRSANDGQAGAKVAAGILKFLSPKDGEPHVHGASIERLQRVAKTSEGRIKARGKGRP